MRWAMASRSLRRCEQADQITGRFDPRGEVGRAVRGNGRRLAGAGGRSFRCRRHLRGSRGGPCSASWRTSSLAAAWKRYLKKEGGDEQAELANVGELINSAAEYDQENPEGSLQEYLAIISLVSDVDHMKGARRGGHADDAPRGQGLGISGGRDHRAGRRNPAP